MTAQCFTYWVHDVDPTAGLFDYATHRCLLAGDHDGPHECECGDRR